MFKHFVKYFFFYICRAKTRQRLLFLAIIGLVLSSFSLIVLQSTMGGLQHKLIERSKKVQGDITLFFKKLDYEEALEINKKIRNMGHTSFLEFEIEILLKNGQYLTPAMAHGIDDRHGLPAFFELKKLNGLVIPNELA